MTFSFQHHSQSPQDSIYQLNNIRITILTSRLIRFEYAENRQFVDEPSQCIWFRNFPTPSFTAKKINNNDILIQTEELIFEYRNTMNPPSPDRFHIFPRDEGFFWHYGKVNETNLKGTTRTLDDANGAIELENGLLSKSGWVVLNDSKSLIFTDVGWITKREESNLDLYFFGYGQDYLQNMKDFFRLSGKIPMIPRWALGNWWSRYWEYSQQNLIDLMQDFQEHQIPISVCIIDMDWHITNIKEYWEKKINLEISNEHKESPLIHDGWTGFTWNTQLFPNPRKLLEFFKENNIYTALNLHPATGIYPHEVQYKAMAEELDFVSEEQKPIPFQIDQPKFAQVYFEQIIHPLEQEGIDFWWMDWQQGDKTETEGLDPLWWLNHLHYLDQQIHSKKRPMIFSRWGGLGNHRYPIGFSGDTYITWESLAFQPYFTSTASNVGFTWWSHDIGGHMGGYEDSELLIRWVQFGCVSPILRLHSTKNTFIEKLPWEFDNQTYAILQKTLQFRHKLIPYIYSMMWQTYRNGIPLCIPLYYFNPKAENAYCFPNEYYFGTELMINPITSKISDSIGASRQKTYLPKGRWIDFYTGITYKGNQTIVQYYSIEKIPIFAKAGAIIPLTSNITNNATTNPADLEVILFPGRNNQFHLYEDDGISQSYLSDDYCLTCFDLQSSRKECKLIIKKVEGNLSYIPNNRIISIKIRGIKQPKEIRCRCNEKIIPISWKYKLENYEVNFSLEEYLPNNHYCFEIVPQTKSLLIETVDIRKNLSKLLRTLKISHNLKDYLFKSADRLIKNVQSLEKLSEFFLSLKKLIHYPISLEKAANQIIIGYILQAIYPKLMDLSFLQKNLEHIDENSFSSLQPMLWNLFHQSNNFIELQSLEFNQLRALIETIVTKPIEIEKEGEK